MCNKVDISCHVSEAVLSVASGGLDQLRTDANAAALDSLHSLATFWLKVDSPTIATDSGENWTNTTPVGFMQDKVLSVSVAIFTVAILVAGIRMAWEQRAKPLQELLKATMLFVCVCGAGTAVVQLLTSWSDEFAVDVVTKASGGSVETALTGLVQKGDVADSLTRDMPIFLAMGISLTVVCASLIQVVLMLIRSAMLVLLAGTLPLAAAATNTEVGRAWFKKYCAWVLAFIAYKPAAALVYAAAIKMNEESMLPSDNNLVEAMTGIMMLMLAVFALPALLRLAVPVTAAVAGGSSGMGNSVADPGGVATGAINIGHSAFGGRSSGGGGSSSGGGGSSGGATGAKAVGAAASVGLGAAGAAVNGARKVAGGAAGAAAHSAGESGGGSITPTSSFGPMSRGASRARAPRPPSTSASSSVAQERLPEPAGPRGSR
jgi:type IV secretion system protein TrbL